MKSPAGGWPAHHQIWHTASGRTAFGHPVDDVACATDIRTQAPKDVSVSKVNITGDTATAVADKFTFKLARVTASG